MSDNVLICCFAHLAATKEHSTEQLPHCAYLAALLRICLEHICSEVPGQNKAKRSNTQRQAAVLLHTLEEWQHLRDRRRCQLSRCFTLV